MDNNSCINEVVNLYFKGYSVKQALKITKNKRKQAELKKIVQAWESEAKKAPVEESRGWKFQQARLV